MTHTLENKANPLLELVGNKIEGMSRAQRMVAEYLLCSPSSAVGLSLNEIAEETKTSRATVIRFCKELGLSGYKELQQYLMKSVLRGLPDATRDETLQWSFTSAMQAVSETLSLLDVDELERAVEHCVNAHSIVWYGLGDSGSLAQSGQHKCWVMGMNSKAFIEPSSFGASRMAVSESDALVVISQSGEGDYVIRPVQVALSRKMPVIAITSNKFSWLASNSTVSLFTATRKVFHEYGLVSIRAGQEAVVNALILKVAKQRGIPYDWRPQDGKGEWPKKELY